jgi:hypothetical protein
VNRVALRHAADIKGGTAGIASPLDPPHLSQTGTTWPLRAVIK